MNNKIRTYVLLVVVVAFLGSIGFKVWGGLINEVPEPIVQNMMETFRPKKTIAIDTFSIQEVSRDPFLGTIKKKEAPPTKKTVRQPIEWMPIIFSGLLKNTQTGQQVFVVQIGGTEHLLKKGSQVGGITLIKGSAKNIVVAFKGVKKTIEITK